MIPNIEYIFFTSNLIYYLLFISRSLIEFIQINVLFLIVYLLRCWFVFSSIYIATNISTFKFSSHRLEQCSKAVHPLCKQSVSVLFLLLLLIIKSPINKYIFQYSLHVFGRSVI